MNAQLLNGAELAIEQQEALKARLVEIDQVPSFAAVLVGDDPASHLYVSLKEKAAKKVGIDFHKYLFPVDISQEDLVGGISFLREDDDVDGIVIQMPLPPHLDPDVLIDEMGAEKDVDGFHPDNINLFNEGASDALWPVFPKAMIDLALSSDVVLSGKRAVIIGKSDLFLEAMQSACNRVGLSVTMITGEQVDAEVGMIREADVVFSACGIPGLIKGGHIKEGAIIVDGGISKVDGKTVGDVDSASAVKKAGFISPVPGGVGPVTVVNLLENVIRKRS